MKKVFLVIILISTLLTYFSCSSSETMIKKTEKSDYNKLYSVGELKSDLEYMLRKSIDIHPAFYSKTDNETFSKEYNKVLNGLTQPLTRVNYYKRISPLLSMLKDGHTAVSFPDEEWEDFRNTNGKMFPFIINYKNASGIIVASSLDSGNILPIGTRILKINNLSADSLFDEFKRYIGCERNAYNQFITSYYFRRYLWLHKINAPFKITYLSNEQNIENTLYSHGVEKGEQKTNYKFYDYLHLPENIGYMIYNQMGNDPSEPFDEFLEKVFSDLQTSKARGLIIDIRNNGGGNNDYINHLLPYITDKPFRGDSKMYRKISKEYKSQMRENISSVLRWVTYPPVVWLGALFSDELKVFTTSEGTLLEFNHETLKYGTNKLQFKGKVCFLIGTATFSSAVDLADAVKTYNIATIIGEETGGIPSAYGDRVFFSLPNTNLEVSVSSAKYVRANGDSMSVEGVLPDIEIRQLTMESKNNTDAVLERAKGWIIN